MKISVGDLLYWPDTNRLAMVRELNVGVANNVYVEYIPEYHGYVSKDNAIKAKKDLDILRQKWYTSRQKY